MARRNLARKPRDLSTRTGHNLACTCGPCMAVSFGHPLPEEKTRVLKRERVIHRNEQESRKGRRR